MQKINQKSLFGSELEHVKKDVVAVHIGRHGWIGRQIPFMTSQQVRRHGFLSGGGGSNRRQGGQLPQNTLKIE